MLFSCDLSQREFYYPKRQPHKMANHTQPIRRQKLTDCLSLFGHFVGLALKWLSQQ